MSDFIVLACPSCAGNLRVTSDLERFACSHCGREHLVKRGGGHISLIPFVQQLDRIGGGVDRQASEMAIRRLREDKRTLQDRIKEWRRDHGSSRHEFQSQKNRSIIQFVCSGVALFLSIAFVAQKPLIVLGGLGFVASAVLCLIGVVGYSQLPRIQLRVESSRQKLDKLYRRLDDVEEELGKHHGVVRL